MIGWRCYAVGVTVVSCGKNGAGPFVRAIFSTVDRSNCRVKWVGDHHPSATGRFACDCRCSTVEELVLAAVFASCFQLLRSWCPVDCGYLPGCLLKGMCQPPDSSRCFNCWDIGGGHGVCAGASTVESRRIAQCCQRCLVLTFPPHSSQRALRETLKFLQATSGYMNVVSSYSWWRGSGGTP